MTSGDASASANASMARQCNKLQIARMCGFPNLRIAPRNGPGIFYRPIMLLQSQRQCPRLTGGQFYRLLEALLPRFGLDRIATCGQKLPRLRLHRAPDGLPRAVANLPEYVPATESQSAILEPQLQPGRPWFEDDLVLTRLHQLRLARSNGIEPAKPSLDAVAPRRQLEQRARLDRSGHLD